MTFSTWIAFVATSCLVLAMPGPTALMILRYAAAPGRGAISRLIAGAVLGDAVALAVCSLGLGALLATSSDLLTILKCAAAAYLIGLGIMTLFDWTAKATPAEGDAAPTKDPSRKGGGRPFLSVFLVTAHNPKGIAFFCALLPQFIDGTAPIAPQLAIVQVTFCALSAVSALSWALAGRWLRRAAGGNTAARRLLRRGTGLLLVAAGVAQATGRLA